MITPTDIQNSKLESGFSHVGYHKTWPQPKLWQAFVGGGLGGYVWAGPRRDSALQAAQDYCDYANGLPIAKQPKRRKAAPKLKRMLNRANHPVRNSHKTSPQSAKPRVPRAFENLPGSVYLVGILHHSSAVKIGWSSLRGFPRLNELQTGNPNLLIGLAEFDGTLNDEYELHCRYEPDNILNEWFKPSPELLAEFDLSEEEFTTIIGANLFKNEALDG